MTIRIAWGYRGTRAEVRTLTFASVARLVGGFNVARGELTWLPRIPEGRDHHAMAFDSGRGVAVMFGGERYPDDTLLNETWEWDGVGWNMRATSGPSPRSKHVMAYDSRRGVTVLFGGFDGKNRNDTWEWDGNAWTLRADGGPSRRVGEWAMAYDSARGVCVLYGGQPRNRTWEWDGTSWARWRKVNDMPAAKLFMTFDSTRGRAVLYSERAKQTWESEGQTWRRVEHGSGPPGAISSAFSFDQTRGVAVYSTTTYWFHLWEWNGQTWSHHFEDRELTISPAAAYDNLRAETVVLGRKDGAESSTWAWDGESLEKRSTLPTRHGYPELVYDIARHVAVFFNSRSSGELTQTWEWDGANWHLRSEVGPQHREYFHMAYDSVRGVTVLYGGNGDEFYGDTWEWDGIEWRLRATSGPPPSAGHSMAFDSARGVTVLCGGGVGRDTWEWDGTTWQIRPATVPRKYSSPGMAYDSRRGVTVMHGGYSRNRRGYSSRTWEWDGNTWTLLAVHGPPMTGAGMAYDSDRGLTVLFGRNRRTQVDETWEWDGVTWSKSAAECGVSFGELAYDSFRGEMIKLGGIYGVQTWVYRDVP